MFGIMTSLTNAFAGCVKMFLNREIKHFFEINSLKKKIKELEKLKYVEKPGRNLFKMIFMITVHSLNRFFAAHMQLLEPWTGSSLKNMRESAHEVITDFFKKRPNVKNWCNCSTLHDSINLLFMFLADDNAYRVIFDRILERWQNNKLIIRFSANEQTPIKLLFKRKDRKFITLPVVATKTKKAKP